MIAAVRNLFPKATTEFGQLKQGVASFNYAAYSRVFSVVYLVYSKAVYSIAIDASCDPDLGRYMLTTLVAKLNMHAFYNTRINVCIPPWNR